MSKRFKTKRKKNFLKVIVIVFIIYLTFSFVYRALFKSYISKLSNEEIINDIISSSKNNYVSEGFFEKYTKPEYILKYTLDLELKDTEETVVLEVENEVINQNDNTEYDVYIYSTHDKEGYRDSYLENYNIVPNVKTAQYILEEYLTDFGVNVLIEERSVAEVLKKNNWAYKKSYEASRIYASEVINKNKELKLVIDLHRDSSSLSKTLLDYNGKKYARILFVVGKEHENYEYNKELAETFSLMLEEEVQGISRGISLKSGLGVNGIYNQDLSKKSILIELGGQYNEIEELNNSLEVLSKVILKYLEGV